MFCRKKQGDAVEERPERAKVSTAVILSSAIVMVMQGRERHSAGCRDVTFSNPPAPPQHATETNAVGGTSLLGLCCKHSWSGGIAPTCKI